MYLIHTNEAHKNCKIDCLQLLIASPVHLAHVFLSNNSPFVPLLPESIDEQQQHEGVKCAVHSLQLFCK